jgi:hypothetical protein
MRNLMIIVLFVVIGFLLCRAYATRKAVREGQPQERRPTEVVRGVVHSSRQVGRNTADAMNALEFPES